MQPRAAHSAQDDMERARSQHPQNLALVFPPRRFRILCEEGKKIPSQLLTSKFFRAEKFEKSFFPLSLFSPRNNELSNKQRKDPSALCPSRGCSPVSAVAPLFYRAASPDSLEQPPAGRRRRRRREGEGVMMSGMDGGRGNTGGERERIGALINSQKRQG